MKLVINAAKCDDMFIFCKMCCKMVWKFWEIWKFFWELASRLAKVCEISCLWDFISQCEIYGMYSVDLHYVIYIYVVLDYYSAGVVTLRKRGKITGQTEVKKKQQQRLDRKARRMWKDWPNTCSALQSLSNLASIGGASAHDVPAS